MKTLHSVVDQFEGWDLDISSTGRIEMKFPNMYMASLAVVEIESNWADRLVYVNHDVPDTTKATVVVIAKFQV